MKKIIFYLSLAAFPFCAGSCQSNSSTTNTPSMKNDPKQNEEWKTKLTPEQYAITCEGSTEAPFTGQYLHNKEAGTYQCVRCSNPLFGSDTKYDSGSGWPSFYKPAKDSSVSEKKDISHGMIRTEVVCNKCGAHLGHVFEDGPNPTGLRYCINSGALNFEKK